MTRNRAPLLLSGLALLAAVAAVWGANAPAPDATSRDLVIVPVEMPEVPAAQGGASIDWTDGVLRVTGRGRPSRRAKTPAQRRLTAREAALIAATRNLAFAVAGAPVTSDATLEEYVKGLGGEVSFQFRTLGYDRMLEPRLLDDEGVEVTLELDLRGKRDMAAALYGAGAKEEQVKPELRAEGAAGLEGLTPASARGPFTGLIVVADGLGARPILRPQLYDAKGERVYGPGVASLDAASRRGLATYCHTLDGARAHAPRMGKNPLVVRAAGVNTRNRGELLLTAEDADRVRAAEGASGFLKHAAVAIVLDRK